MTDARRKITVQLCIWVEDMAMETTDEALECVKSVMVHIEDDCRERFQSALADAGAKNITVHMLAY